MSTNQEETSTIVQAQIVNDDFKRWSTDEVVTWCATSLELPEDDPLINQLKENEINGEFLPDLSLEDLKELCESDLTKAIRFKVLLNKLQHDAGVDSKLQEQQENMIITLKNLHSTLSQKLQDFQSQYTKLRLDVLEIVKNPSVSPRAPAQLHPSSHQLHQQQSSHLLQQPSDYFDGPHHPGDNSNAAVVHPMGSTTSLQTKPPSLSNKPSMTRSGSSQFNAAMTPGLLSSGSNEPLKQLRASKEDSCERILKNAMKRHHLNEQDWKQYVLVICYGDQERILDLEEKPVVIFKNLKQQGLHPAIMLRRRGDFEELNMSGEDVTPGGRL